MLLIFVLFVSLQKVQVKKIKNKKERAAILLCVHVSKDHPSIGFLSQGEDKKENNKNVPFSHLTYSINTVTTSLLALELLLENVEFTLREIATVLILALLLKRYVFLHLSCVPLNVSIFSFSKLY